MDKIKFEISKIEVIEEVSNSQLSKIKMWIAKSGDNKHKLPIDREAITLSKSSLVGKPVLVAYNVKEDKFEGHESWEIPVGVFLKESDISFEEIDNELWIISEAYIWKKYFPYIMEVFKKQDGKSDISMEIQVLEMEEDDNKINHIKLFAFLGVTLIGTSPAIPNAKAEVLKFSELVSETEKIINFKDGEIMFNKEEFAQTFSMTANELWELLQCALSDAKYQDGDDSYTRYWMRDYDGSYMYAYDYQERKLCAIPYFISDGKCVANFENAKNCKMTYVITDEDSEDMTEFAKKIMSKEISKYEKDIEAKCAEVETEKTKYSELEVKYSELETSVNDVQSKLTESETKFSELETINNNIKSENSTLLEFKEKVLKDERDSKIEFALSEVEDILNKDQVSEWRDKSKEFSEVSEFANALKAFAFDINLGKPNKNNTIPRIHIPQNNDDNQNANKSVWERI